MKERNYKQITKTGGRCKWPGQEVDAHGDFLAAEFTDNAEIGSDTNHHSPLTSHPLTLKKEAKNVVLY
jgi:hypothetical protein